MISNQDETKQDDTWMAAMFGGINAVIAYYEPIIINKATLYQDKSRATLNDHDLEQTCRLTIARVWEKQSSCLDIVNFDMMVKWCMDNALRSEVSREYTQKRGRCKISFFSEMETDHDGEESAGMMDRSMFKSEDAREQHWCHSWNLLGIVP